MIPAILALEDGRVFHGRRFGADGEFGGEVVFNTSMIGYQEILGDPSYAKQIVVMTYPMMGNYGIAPEDFESRSVFLTALVCKEPSRIASNWRHDRTLDDYLRAQNAGGFCDLDTRALVRHLRSQGAKRGYIGDASVGIDTLVDKARAVISMQGADLARVVSVTENYSWDERSPLLPKSDVEPPKYHVVVMDFGVKRNILRRLVDVGCRVTVVPGNTGARDILALKPDGVLLSNGPGDPEPVSYGIRTVQDLLGKVPIFGICLGHQLLALAIGAKSFKLKFGHRGANHPVMDLTTRKVEITSQNHGFSIDPDSLKPSIAEVTHLNLNDNTLEGLRLVSHPAFSVQYHPEAAPGPHDAGYLFARFTGLMDASTHRKREV
jgi:carbamoyl-phosphate synthase small subunit